MSSSQKFVISIIVWFVVLFCIIGVYKLAIDPRLQEQKQQDLIKQQNQDKQFFQVKTPERVLSDEDWLNLKSIGNLDINIAPFKRGSSELSDTNQSILNGLSNKLKEKPNYYLIIKMIASNNDDKDVADSNMQLARDRANTIIEYLYSNGINKNRMHVTSEFGISQNVEFILAQ